MNLIELKDEYLMKVKVGEALTLTTIMTILVASIVAVIVYRIFMSNKGSTSLPGGFKFTWS